MTWFNGPSALILLEEPTAGVLNVNVDVDLYSEWKVWMTGLKNFDTEDDVDGSGELITIADYSWYTGQRVVYLKLGGAEAIGLTDGAAYFVRFITRSTFELYDTKSNAEAGPSTTGRIDLTASGVGNGESHQFSADNSKFLNAFRSAGGDPLTPGVTAGSYTFLQNQAGFDWRVVSSDEDQTVNYSGNLVGEDSGVSLINVTPGRSVLHLGLQPVTQRVDEILLQAQEAAYDGQVSIDVTTSNVGTVFPVGTRSRPVNNVVDMFSIANNLGVSALNVIGSVTFDRDVNGFSIVGGTSVDHDQIALGGFDFDDTVFRGATITGTMTGRVEIIESKLQVVLGLDGFFRRCGLEGNLSLGSSSISTFDSCFSRVPGTGQATVSVGTNAQAGFRNWSGGLEIRDMTAGAIISVDMDPGKVILDSSCTGGTLQIRGIGELEDNSGGAVTVNKAGLLSVPDLDAMIQAAVGNADVSGDDLTITIRDSALAVLRTLSVSADGRIRRIV